MSWSLSRAQYSKTAVRAKSKATNRTVWLFIALEINTAQTACMRRELIVVREGLAHDRGLSVGLLASDGAKRPQGSRSDGAGAAVREMPSPGALHGGSLMGSPASTGALEDRLGRVTISIEPPLGQLVVRREHVGWRRVDEMTAKRTPVQLSSSAMPVRSVGPLDATAQILGL